MTRNTTCLFFSILIPHHAVPLLRKTHPTFPSIRPSARPEGGKQLQGIPRRHEQTTAPHHQPAEPPHFAGIEAPPRPGSYIASAWRKACFEESRPPLGRFTATTPRAVA